MRFLITTGPTREYIDSVRFISNGSSGRMGCAVAASALAAGAEVTILAGPGVGDLPEGATVHRFVSVAELQALLDEHFPICDVLVMAAAVGDFTVENTHATKLSRHGGAVDIRLLPTPDLLGGLKPLKQSGQTVVSFAVEDGEEAAMLAKAREEMILKGADYCVLNTPAAMGSETSRACVLYGDGRALSWAERPKTELAAELVGLVMT